MKFLAIILALTFASAQLVSINNFIRSNKPILPNIPKFEQQPIRPDIAKGSLSDFSAQLQDGFLPCNGRDSCGQAQNFRDKQEFFEFVQRYAIQNIPTLGRPSLGSASIPMTMEANSIRDSSNLARAPQPALGRDFSGTNNQVSGVDQADLLKTDGTYIYTFSNKILSIVLAYPADRAYVVSKIDLKDLNAQALFIEGNYLSIFGTDYSLGNPFTFIRIYDVRNRARPFLTKTYRVSGSYQNGRKTDDGFVYLITSQSINRNIRPWFDFGLGTSEVAFNSIYRYQIDYNRPQLTNIVSFNLRKPTNSERRVVSICGQTSNIMYMSSRSIYLTTNSYENRQDYTIIRKIFIRGKNIIPFADGKIRGSINNQFSMDEYGPYLRVATTLNDRTPTNAAYSLGFYLQPYGKITGIAPGQRIFSARYVDKRLYLVTFRQVDPFFVISFDSHKNPKILGQLKVPGFSRYLHPYDQTTIIGLGRQADQSGRQLGLKVSLFDVSDCSSPRQIAKLQVQQKFASSTAEWEHKAFLFSAQKNILVIPTTMNDAVNKFNGALALRISKQEQQISIKAAIDHLSNDLDNFYQRGVERSLYIEELLYTKSKCLIRIHDIVRNFKEVKDINLPCDQRIEPIVYNPLPIRPRPTGLQIPIDDPIRPRPTGLQIPIDDPVILAPGQPFKYNNRFAI